MQFEAGIIGVDEAGRGPLAGPVVASAVLLNKDHIPEGINDSKKLSEKKRTLIYQKLLSAAIIGVGIVGPRRIEKLNILQATMLAMEHAVFRLLSLAHNKDANIIGNCCRRILIDGNKIPTGLSEINSTELKLFHQSTIFTPRLEIESVIKGDTKDTSIAAASIVAKVTRDRIMKLGNTRYPEYNFANHKGYPTKAHRDAIIKYGRCPMHRKTFKISRI